jgi:NADH-quinone oxidoreductase subunit J
MAPEFILFFLLGLVAVVSALGMLFSRNAVYSALFLIVNFATVAVFYLQLSAPFIALSQVTVYAGAIMVLFLFVIMLLGAERSGRTPAVWWNQPLALFLGAVLLVEAATIVLTQRDTLPGIQALPEGFGSPTAVGELLFDQYLLPFEVTSILLLTSMVGAIVLTLRERRREKAERRTAARQTRPERGVLRQDGPDGAGLEPASETTETVRNP